MFEPQRTLLMPGQGIVKEPLPVSDHTEYPKHMIHPGYQPASVGTEVRSPHGFTYFIGGTAIRFPPVLVMDADQEARHAADGYVSIGKSDPAAFARAVAASAPPVTDYKPDEYPKWVNGRVVNSAEEEAELLGLPMPAATSEAPATAPEVDTEVNSLEVQPAPMPGLGGDASEEDEIAALEAKLAALKAKKAAPIVTLNEKAIDEPLVMKETVTQANTPADVGVALSEEKPREMTRGEKIKLGMARKKAERAAKAATEAEAEQTKAAQAQQHAGDAGNASC